MKTQTVIEAVPSKGSSRTITAGRRLSGTRVLTQSRNRRASCAAILGHSVNEVLIPAGELALRHGMRFAVSLGAER
jgi:hypothetical protein